MNASTLDQRLWIRNEVYELVRSDKNILLSSDSSLNDKLIDAAQKLHFNPFELSKERYYYFNVHKWPYSTFTWRLRLLVTLFQFKRNNSWFFLKLWKIEYFHRRFLSLVSLQGKNFWKKTLHKLLSCLLSIQKL